MTIREWKCTFNPYIPVTGSGLFADFQYRQEGFLGDVYFADSFHAFFALFLLVEEFALSADVAAVALGEDVFFDGAYRLAGYEFAADGGLDGSR